MIFTVIDLYDVLRTDICGEARTKKCDKRFSTFPWDYISKDGFYI